MITKVSFEKVKITSFLLLWKGPEFNRRLIEKFTKELLSGKSFLCKSCSRTSDFIVLRFSDYPDICLKFIRYTRNPVTLVIHDFLRPGETLVGPSGERFTVNQYLGSSGYAISSALEKREVLLTSLDDFMKLERIPNLKYSRPWRN